MSRRRNRILGASLAATLAASAYAAYNREAVADLAYAVSQPGTDVERRIEEIVAQKYGANIMVHCADVSGNRDDFGVQASLKQLPFGRYVLRVDDGVCKTLEAVVANPASVSFSQRLAGSIATVAHEYSHMYGHEGTYEDNEGIAQCLEVQRAPEVALEFGLTPGVARQIGEYVSLTGKIAAPGYEIPAGCENGGIHDVNSDVAGTYFPTDPIEAYINGAD